MSEENINQSEENEENEPQKESAEQNSQKPKRRIFTRRNAVIAVGLLGILAVLLTILTTVSYRYGVFDSYIREQFRAKMERMNIVFEADVFRVTIAPLKLELRNATFNDKISGEKLFFIRNANVGLTVKNLYDWQLNRDISVDSTDIRGAEVWVKFDENGKSNFSNIALVEEQNRVNFTYSSIKFSLQEGLVHYGDVSRKIAGDAKNILFYLEPENTQVPDEQKRYKFDLTSTDSNFIYDEKKLEPVDLRAQGIADANGAEITGLSLKTPIGESTLKGKINDWKSPKYDLDIESTIDLTQTTEIFPLGTPLRGIGNFNGKVTGEGEQYKVDGEVFSESLSASNIYLKGLNVNAVVEGKGSMYEANGKAIAQMLTFEDFTIDNPYLNGMIRGTGTDFKWWGELQAAAAKTPLGTVGGLFISDAVAEYKEKKFGADFGNVRFRSFVSEDVNAQNVQTANVKVNSLNGVTDVNAPNVRAESVKTKDIDLKDVTARNLKVRDNPNSVNIKADNLQAQNAQTKEARLKNLSANNVNVDRQNGVTDITAQNLTADQIDANNARIGNVTASQITVRDNPNEMIIYSDGLKVAKIETDSAVLGSLNIAGVRLTIRQGVIEGTSGEIDAGNVTLTKNKDLSQGGSLGNVKIYKPIFVIEPSGRYRASADMSLGGGVLGSINLGAARAAVAVNNEQVDLRNLTADVMDGKLNGNATIAFDTRRRSEIKADFTNLNIGKLLALQGGRIVPIEGQTTGNVDISFNGTNFKTASGNLVADITANAGTSEKGFVPVNGRVKATATNGLFNLNYAKLNTDKSEFNADGQFDLNGDNSNLNLALNSTDAGEIERIFRVLSLSPEFERQIDEYQAEFAGNLKFNGNLIGNISDPTINGNASLDSLILRGRNLGSLETGIFVSPVERKLDNGILREADGGTLAFNLTIPNGGTNNISVDATLNKINIGNILTSLPIDLPENLRGLQAATSGTLNLKGLPKAMEGEANLTATNGTLKGETFDNLEANAVFSGTLITIEKFNAKFGDGNLTAAGTYQTDTNAFNFDVEGKNIIFARIRPFIAEIEDIPDIGGMIDLKAKAIGIADNSTTYDINFNGTGRSVTINGNTLGDIVFNGKTENQQLIANLTANLEGQQQNITANINFADENIPLRAETVFDNSEIAPYIALIRPPSNNITLSGTATGRVFLEGNLRMLNAKGKREFTSENLRGFAEFSRFDLLINQTPLNAVEPIRIDFNSREVVVNNAKFAGGGSNVVVNGTKALRDNGINNLAIDGRINLTILNLASKSKNAFFAGLADVNVRLTGPNKTSRLNGSAELQNASAAFFVGTERITFERITGNAIFTSNQVQLNQLNGFLGGGKFTATGGAFLDDKLNLQAFRVNLTGNNVTVPLPKDFRTTGDAQIEINGKQGATEFNTFIAGKINAKRSIYTRDIDLADVISGRREGSLSQGDDGNSPFGNVQLDLIVEGRDALVVRNNLADLTASLSLRVSGDLDFPQVAGRITANSGTLFYRNDRYILQRGELIFPPNTGEIEPLVNIQAESEISGYQVFVNLNGKLTDTENLQATVRSNPALPQADVISLITTGSLANTENGIPTLAQSGITTAAEVLTDEVINKPIAKATDKLFGLNKFQLDPIISGQRLNPTARLTVGRQINRNLAVTYSTNLSEDQNQVLALEYRVSNRLSFVAQYAQRSLSNVTRNKDSFSFEIRLRRRF
jgi:translocation and assembly module TamB